MTIKLEDKRFVRVSSLQLDLLTFIKLGAINQSFGIVYPKLETSRSRLEFHPWTHEFDNKLFDDAITVPHTACFS